MAPRENSSRSKNDEVHSRSGLRQETLQEASAENEPLSPGGRTAGMTQAEMLTRLAHLEQREATWASQVEHEARLATELAQAKIEHAAALALERTRLANVTSALASMPRHPPTEPSAVMKATAPHPPKFSGKKGTTPWRDWLLAIRNYFTLVAIQQDAWVLVAQGFLEGAALTTWNLATADAADTEWTSFVKRMEQTYGDTHTGTQARQEILQLRQTTSVEAYNASFRELVLKLRAAGAKEEMSVGDKRFFYLRGLKSHLREALPTTNGYEDMDMPAIMSRALHMDTMHMISVNMTQGKAELSHDKPSEKVKHRSFPKPGKKRFAEHNAGPSESKKLKYKVKLAEMREKNLCFGCGQAGHAIKDCPTKQAKTDYKGKKPAK